jgi:hypothetical protein
MIQMADCGVIDLFEEIEAKYHSFFIAPFDPFKSSCYNTIAKHILSKQYVRKYAP